MYQFNPYAIPPLVTGLFLTSMGLFVFLKNRKSMTNLSYALITWSSAVWQFSYCMAYLSQDKNIAVFWCRIVYTGVAYISTVTYHFSVSLLNLERQKRFVRISYIIATVFSVLAVTDYFITDVYKYFWGYYTKASILHTVFVCAWPIPMLAALVNLHRGSKTAQLPLERSRLRYIFMAIVIGYIGAIDYVPIYGIEIYPFGFIPVIIFMCVIAYCIIQYKLMDIETVFHKTLIWVVASSVVFLPIILFSYWLRPWYRQATPFKVAILCAGIFYFLTIYLKYIQPKIDHFFQRRKYDLQNASERFVSELVHLKTPAELTKKIQQTISGTVYATNISIQSAGLSPEDNFLRWLSKNNNIIYKDFIETDPEYEAIRNLARQYFEKLGAVVIIPLILDDKLLAVISLGKKSNLKRYNVYDFQFLLRLKNESTIALSNSLLYGRVEEEVQLRTHELVQAQKQLIQAEKLATVGTLAGGVAHEINNPLTAVLTNAQMLLMEAKTEDEKESLKLIEEAAKRCRSIVQKLMVYSRKPLGGREVKDIDLEKALNNVIAFLSYQLAQDNIKINAIFENPPFIISGSMNELEQVFTNLILNAKDAIKHAKKSGQIDIYITKTKNKIIITVKDDGIGIQKEHILKIFDPFFTTKDVGKGTGLGLSICQSIIEEHKGKITVESQPGQGAAFIVTLPAY